jgi:hypothetical protein
MSVHQEAIAAYQLNILILPWSDVFKQMDAFIKKIQPFADLVDHVIPYAQAYSPPWKKNLEEIAVSQANSLNKILEAFENSDPAGLSDEICNVFLPLTQKTLKLFGNEIIPFLKTKVEEDKPAS